MVLKRMVPALVCAALFAVGSVAMADEYRADDYLSLDLSKAVLSPKRLGPAAEFAPVAVEAKSESKSDRASEASWARDELTTEPRKVAVQNVRVTHPHRATHVASERPKGAARTRLAHRNRNPLDAQAMDAHVQKWPCKSGGICNWKQ